MNAQCFTDIVRNSKRTVFRRGVIVRPISVVDLLDRSHESEGETRRQSYKRMWRARLFMFFMLVLAMMLPTHSIWALPMGDRISYRDFTFPSLVEPFFIEVSTYSLVHAPWPQNLGKEFFTREYIGRADLEMVNRRAINNLKNIAAAMGHGSVLLGDAAGGKIRFMLDDEADGVWIEDEQAEGKFFLE